MKIKDDDEKRPRKVKPHVPYQPEKDDTTKFEDDYRRIKAGMRKDEESRDHPGVPEAPAVPGPAK